MDEDVEEHIDELYTDMAIQEGRIADLESMRGDIGQKNRAIIKRILANCERLETPRRIQRVQVIINDGETVITVDSDR